MIPVLQGEEKAPAQQKVAEEDGDLVLPERIDREDAPPPLGLVDDVVVDERGRVEQLDERGRPVAGLRDPAAGAGREQHQRRPDPLALLAQDVLRHLVEQAHVRAHRLAEIPLERLQLRRDDLLDGGQRDRPVRAGQDSGGVVHAERAGGPSDRFSEIIESGQTIRHTRRLVCLRRKFSQWVGLAPGHQRLGMWSPRPRSPQWPVPLPLTRTHTRCGGAARERTARRRGPSRRPPGVAARAGAPARRRPPRPGRGRRRGS